MKRSLTLFAAAVLAALSLAAPVRSAEADGPSRVRGGGWLDMVSFSNQTGVTTVGFDPIAVPKMNINFTSLYTGPITVTFSAVAVVPGDGGEVLTVTALLDGSPMAPGQINFEMSGFNGARSYTWAAGNIDPGFHVVRIMAHTLFGNTGQIIKPTLTVMHAQ